MVASLLSQLDCVKVLLEFGSTVDLLSRLLDTPFPCLFPPEWHMSSARVSAIYLAGSMGHINIDRLLLEYGAEPNSSTCSPLCGACMGGNTEMAKFLIDRGAEINLWSSLMLYWTTNPLAAAASSGNTELVKYLIEKGAYLNCNGCHYKCSLRSLF